MRVGLSHIYPNLIKSPTTVETDVAVIHQENALANPDLASFQEACPRITVAIYDPDTGCVQPVSSGSGIVLSADGLILTAKHVVDDENIAKLAGEEDSEKLLEIYRRDGLTYFIQIPVLDDKGSIDFRTHLAHRLDMSDDDDLATLAIDFESKIDDSYSGATDLKYLPINTEFRNSGDLVYAIGHTFAYPENTLSQGRIIDHNSIGSSINLANHSFDDSNYLRALRHLSAASKKIPADKTVSTNYIAEGTSGGILCNPDGELVGMPVSYIPNTEAGSKEVSSVTTISENPRVINGFLDETLPRLQLQRLQAGKTVDTADLIHLAKRKHSFHR